jgi:hypothetical protein
MNIPLILLTCVGSLFLLGGVVAYIIRKVFDLVVMRGCGDYITTAYIEVNE